MIRRRLSRPGLVLSGLLWVAAVTAVVLAILDDGDGPTPSEPGPSQVERCAPPLIGVHSALTFEADAAKRAANVAAIHDVLGAQIVRASLLWNQIEPVEGQRDWSRPDSVVQELTAVGIQPLFVVIGSPSWANGVPESTPGHDVFVPPQGAALDQWLERYEAFLAETVERYKGAVERWEIWNEPNLQQFWRPRPDPAAYREVYEALRATILKADPTAEVAVGGLTGLEVTAEPSIPGLEFLGYLIRTGTPLDNVAIHPYSDDRGPADPLPGHNNFDDILRARQMLAAAGHSVPIWVTEWGWPTPSVGAAAQADYVDTSLTMIERRYPFVRVATYFVDHDLPPDYAHGLLDQDLNPKPAAFAFRKHADLAAARCHESQVGRG